MKEFEPDTLINFQRVDEIMASVFYICASKHKICKGNMLFSIYGSSLK